MLAIYCPDRSWRVTLTLDDMNAWTRRKRPATPCGTDQGGPSMKHNVSAPKGTDGRIARRADGGVLVTDSNSLVNSEVAG